MIILSEDNIDHNEMNVLDIKLLHQKELAEVVLVLDKEVTETLTHIE